ncbi:MAG: fatty acid desaturase [Flavobacteriales bacterium]|nr:fatty acid desaturase [Flavobacteriales bacterium]MCB9165889.1 fatty acid desaturase [Flavobacteriales bacterium]MCB9194559.1 fatty acid desaturase [Flavobacteriales bacterium]
MREGKDLILATRPFAQEFRGRSWWHLCTSLVVLFMGYAVAAMAEPWWGRFIGSVLVALTLGRIFVIYHDYLHHAILQRSFLAKAFFTVFGLFMLAPVSIWERSHNYHHAHNSKLYTSSIGSYPVVTKEKFLASSRLEQRVYLFIRHPLTIGMGYIFMFLYGMCIRSVMNNPGRHWDSIIALVLHVAFGSLLWVFLGWWTFFFVFLLPFVFVLALGSYLFYAQHNFPGVTFSDKDGWTYANAALNSSSHMKMSPVMRWFLANIGYHHIHHLNPRIPFYRLPEVHAAIPELQHAKATSLLPWDVVRCLRLKVWDPAQQRMITRRELRRTRLA